mmetsp:Transcript_2878/g.10950  ORF Transcript_2878/g.10950 Transcript_2878/m.10950 type:complete len:273 (-) Transcript_2878:439-1257(-)
MLRCRSTNREQCKGRDLNKHWESHFSAKSILKFGNHYQCSQIHKCMCSGQCTLRDLSILLGHCPKSHCTKNTHKTCRHIRCCTCKYQELRMFHGCCTQRAGLTGYHCTKDTHNWCRHIHCHKSMHLEHHMNRGPNTLHHQWKVFHSNTDKGNLIRHNLNCRCNFLLLYNPHVNCIQLDRYPISRCTKNIHKSYRRIRKYNYNHCRRHRVHVSCTLLRLVSQFHHKCNWRSRALCTLSGRNINQLIHRYRVLSTHLHQWMSTHYTRDIGNHCH